MNPADLTDVAAEDVAVEDAREGERIVAGDAAELDWRRVTLIECEALLTGVGTLRLQGSRVIDTQLIEPVVAALEASDSHWRSVHVSGGRIASLDLSGAELRCITLSGVRIGYLNLRSAEASDLTFTGCRIDTLDMTAGRMSRGTFVDCQVVELSIQHARLCEVDLRGAALGRIEGVVELRGSTIGSDQLQLLAPLLADALGIDVRDEPDSDSRASDDIAP